MNLRPFVGISGGNYSAQSAKHTGSLTLTLREYVRSFASAVWSANLCFRVAASAQTLLLHCGSTRRSPVASVMLPILRRIDVLRSVGILSPARPTHGGVVPLKPTAAEKAAGAAYLDRYVEWMLAVSVLYFRHFPDGF